MVGAISVRVNVYVAWDGDHIGRRVGRLSLADDEEGLRRVSRDIERGNALLSAWVAEVGGSVISAGGDEGRARVPADALEALEVARRRYEQVVGAPASVGVGVRLSQADRALLAAKLRGGDRVVFHTDEVTRELEEAEKKGRTEESKLFDEYLGKAEGPFRSAAFRHRTRGHVVEVGAYHSVDPWLRGGSASHLRPSPAESSAEWEEGFVTRGGHFLNREDAASHARMPPVRHSVTGKGRLGLDSSDAASGLGVRGFQKADPPPPPESPTPESTAPPGSPAGGGGFVERPPVGGGDAGSAPPLSPGPFDGNVVEQQGEPDPGPTGAEAEDEVHQHAQAGAQRDDEEAAAAGSVAATKRKVVQVLQQVRQQAPKLEEIRQVDPELYQALQGVVGSLVVTARALVGQGGDQGQEQPVAKAEPALAGAAFRHRATGQVYPTGSYHDITALAHQRGVHLPEKWDPDVEANWYYNRDTTGETDFDEGFVTHGGEFLDRAAAARKVGAVGNLESCDYADGVAHGEYKSEPSPNEKAELPLPENGPTKHILHLPVGATKGGKVKVRHGDGKTTWVSVRAGQVLADDGHAISSRNPGGR